MLIIHVSLCSNIINTHAVFPLQIVSNLQSG
jgi:hypothetical protein